MWLLKKQDPFEGRLVPWTQTAAHCVQIDFLVSHENGAAKVIPRHSAMDHLFHQNFP